MFWPDIERLILNNRKVKCLLLQVTVFIELILWKKVSLLRKQSVLISLTTEYEEVVANSHIERRKLSS